MTNPETVSISTGMSGIGADPNPSPPVRIILRMIDDTLETVARRHDGSTPACPTCMHPTVYGRRLPSVMLAETGEEIDAEILRGPALARAGIDVRGTIGPGAEVVAIRVAALDVDEPVQLRIPRSYTDATPAFDDGRGRWTSPQRPANSVFIPIGWHLVESSVPTMVSRTHDGQTRIEFDPPAEGMSDVLLTVRRA